MIPMITLMHPNEISGCTIMTDGTKLYWAEGHSVAILINPAGIIIRWLASDPRLRGIDMAPSCRNMTKAEAAEYDATIAGA